MNLVNREDPLDSTFAILDELASRGHEVQVFEQESTTPQLFDLNLNPTKSQPVQECDLLMLRKDPPYDQTFMQDLSNLQLPPTINSPQAILTSAKENLFNYPGLIPPTQIPTSINDLETALQTYQKFVIKPNGSYGGDVFFADNTNLGQARQYYQEKQGDVIFQKYVDAPGDKRILVLDSQILGAYMRLPAPDGRCNIKAGGTAAPATITSRDQEIINALAPELKQRGAIFAGVDIYGEYLLEVNVVSPGGVTRISNLTPNIYPLQKTIADYMQELQ